MCLCVCFFLSFIFGMCRIYFFFYNYICTYSFINISINISYYLTYLFICIFVCFSIFPCWRDIHIFLSFSFFLLSLKLESNNFLSFFLSIVGLLKAVDQDISNSIGFALTRNFSFSLALYLSIPLLTYR